MKLTLTMTIDADAVCSAIAALDRMATELAESVKGKESEFPATRKLARSYRRASAKLQAAYRAAPIVSNS